MSGFWDLFWKPGTAASGGAAGTAGSLGMLGSAGLSIGLPYLLGKMMSGGDPWAKAQASAQRALSMQNFTNLKNQGYDSFVHGQGFGMAQNAAVAGANEFNRALARTTPVSGVGNIRAAMGKSMVGNRMSNLYSTADTQAGEWARAMQQAQANAYMQGGNQPNYGANLAAAGMNAFLPYLLRTRQPGGAASAPAASQSSAPNGMSPEIIAELMRRMSQLGGIGGFPPQNFVGGRY